ncbi:DUF292 domain protein [Aspergillus saccharolyticus JOP 1030-1]|uniref:Uncharacterized protein n=1 Tax=Aspergillus saccharolyticus JOP 1030-1 TaxID=1450539 RepID=A0A318ZW55_9EURO|nr:hypothetical protein BP01DRAFT_353462 [Aspergillus saccharolyticus JOP 1030-1]PYH48320.1 hypothetical protein BP01DRAFT_353462 [Aspergillus saccharolyticus JOP 1030-1]
MKKNDEGGESTTTTTTTDTTTTPPTEYIDAALDEAAAVIFYAWPRFPHEVRELTILRNLLGERYGKDFMALAQDNKLEDVKVPERLVKGLRVRPPTGELVDSYLAEIARAYGVRWGSSSSVDGEVPAEFVGVTADDTTTTPPPAAAFPGESEDGPHGELPTTPRKASASPFEEREARRASETVALNQATPPKGLRASQQGKSPVSVAPPAPRLDNLHPRVKVPGQDSQAAAGAAQGGGGAAAPRAKSEIPELDELTRRFAALRR